MDYFAKNVFRINGDQNITGKWTMASVEIEGELTEGTLINGLNFDTDIVRDDEKGIINIAGFKSFSNLTIDKLICDEPCILKDTDITKWLGTFIYPNQKNIITGKLTVDKINADNVKTDRPINGIFFNTDTILTKSTDQIINGNVTIIADEVLIQNLTVNQINSQPAEFLKDLWRKGDTNPIESQVNFVQPIIVGDLNFDGKMFGVRKDEMDLKLSEADLLYERMVNEVEKFDNVLKRALSVYESKFTFKLFF